MAILHYGALLSFHEIKSLNDIVGNTPAIFQLRNYAEDMEKGVKRKPVLLHGPPGVGKTASALALCRDYDWSVVELSAGEQRDKEAIEKLMLSGANPKNVFGRRNAVLLDEIDELAARFDSGAASAITSLISKSRCPIIFIANDQWDQKIAFLRNKVDAIEFKKLDAASIESLMRRYAKSQKMVIEEESIRTIAARSAGDARSALNDAYALDGAGKDGADALGMRDRKGGIFVAMDKIFLSMTYAAPIAAMANSDVEPDMMIKWIDENIPARYTETEDISRAFRSLSDSTIFAARASRTQYYTYWRYMNALMSSGVALSKTRYPTGSARYAFPRVVKELSASKADRQTSAAVAKKLQRIVHSGMKRIANNEQKLLRTMCNEALKSGVPREEVESFLQAKLMFESGDVSKFLDK